MAYERLEAEMKMTNGIKIALLLVATIFVAFVAYGLQTDCPHTKGYVFCSDAERQKLQE
jgi:hypothetical protein